MTAASLSSAKLLWFSIGAHQRWKLDLLVQTQTPLAEKISCRLSFFPVCEVLTILKHRRYTRTVQFYLCSEKRCLPPAASLALRLEASVPKSATQAVNTPADTSWRYVTWRCRISAIADIQSKKWVNRRTRISTSAAGSKAVTRWTGEKSTALPEVFYNSKASIFRCFKTDTNLAM